MCAEDAIKYVDDKEFLNKLYGFAYKRCRSSQEAEDLCSDIVYALLKSIRKNPGIENFYAFAWTIAHRVYADYSEKRRFTSERIISFGYSDEIVNSDCDPIDEYLKFTDDERQISLIKREIAFLSKTYRDVMVMYYLDEMKTADIAKSLGISETAVKQRLFSARNTIKKEVNKMETNALLKPSDLWMPGMGDLRYGDPRDKAASVLSKNILISCKNMEKSVKQLVEEFNIPTIIMENELDVLRGDLLKKCANGKYIANFIIIDSKLQGKINEMLAGVAKGLADDVTVYLQKSKERILSLKYMSQPRSFEYILWSMIPRFADMVNRAVSASIQKEMSELNVEKEKRHFYVLGHIIPSGENFEPLFYGLNGTSAENIMGFKKVSVQNYLGERLPVEWNRFGATVSFDMHKELGLIFKAAGGLDVESLDENEKEVAGKAIEMGYIKKDDHTLVPVVVMMDTDTEKEWNQLFTDAAEIIDKYAEELCAKYTKLVKDNVPTHLLSQTNVFVEITATALRHYLIECCIENELLYIPVEEKCSEGILALVTR